MLWLGLTTSDLKGDRQWLQAVLIHSSIRLTKGDMSKIKMIENGDVRNFAISRADEVAKHYGWRGGLQ